MVQFNLPKNSRITIGKVDLEPGEVHTIPGRAVFSIVIRDTDEVVMRNLRAGFVATVEAAARDRGLSVDAADRSWIAPVTLDPGLRDVLRQTAEAAGLEYCEMPSGAGHDAQTMAAICPSALVFVPSRGGISHSPQEHTDWADIWPGAELVLNALIRLSQAVP